MNVCHAAVVEIPRGDFAHHLLDNGFWMNLTVLGDLCWAIAYILIIRQCCRQRTYGLPLVAIVMNFTWELQYSLVQPPRCDNGSVDVVKVAMILAWAVLDAFIVWQLFRYGRAEQTIKEIQRFFPFVVVGSLLLALAGNFAFARFHPEEAAPLSGLIINFVMSLLFIFFLFARPGLRGIGWGASWFRVVGNSIIFFANIFLLQENRPNMRGFVMFLFIGTAIFDTIFLVLLHKQRAAQTP
ncbi:MAG TPA: hypothetical protein VIV10_13725 [Gemmatimonadales bacterium]